MISPGVQDPGSSSDDCDRQAIELHLGMEVAENCSGVSESVMVVFAFEK